MVADGGEAVIIDPKWEVEAYLRAAEENGFRITHILETHNHADHLSGKGRLAKAMGAPIHIFKRVGMPQLHILDGGLNGWVAAGKPVERCRERISLERQVRIAAGALAAASGLLAVKAHPRFGLLSAFVGGGLLFAGVTDTCGMARLLTRLPYNQAGCDVGVMIEALKDGEPPVSS
jgi:rhodanese-related sulfurtransferase